MKKAFSIQQLAFSHFGTGPMGEAAMLAGRRSLRDCSTRYQRPVDEADDDACNDPFHEVGYGLLDCQR